MIGININGEDAMPIVGPDPNSDSLWKIIGIGALYLIQMLFGVLMYGIRDQQRAQHEAMLLHDERIRGLEGNSVKQHEFDTDIASLRNDNIRMHQEARVETLRLHGENQHLLRRIETKLDNAETSRVAMRGLMDEVKGELLSELKRVQNPTDVR